MARKLKANSRKASQRKMENRFITALPTKLNLKNIKSKWRNRLDKSKGGRWFHNPLYPYFNEQYASSLGSFHPFSVAQVNKLPKARYSLSHLIYNTISSRTCDMKKNTKEKFLGICLKLGINLTKDY
jgi:hypothetical protein